MESEFMSSPQNSLEFLSPGWQKLLAPEFAKEYMENIRSCLRKEIRDGYRFYPPKDRIFRALQLVDYSEVRVVILGQDPYHGVGQANGLAFAVSEGTPPPPSLINIFKEIEADLGQGRPNSTSLEGWAQQGVLLLNTVLTVRENTPFSHRGWGWEVFTDRVISLINEKNEPVIYLLWGAAAATKAPMITNPLHTILKAPHPSPFSAARGFFGCHHFSRANKILKQQMLPQIDWVLSSPRLPV